MLKVRPKGWRCFVLIVSLAAGACGPRASADPVGTPKPIPRLPPFTGGTKADIKPVVFDPFAAPFAIVQTDAKETECVLPDPTEAAKWRFVPPLLKSQTANPVRNLPRYMPGDANGFCVYEWKDGRSLPKPGDFQKIKAAPDGAVVGSVGHGIATIPKLPNTVFEPLLRRFERLARDIEPAALQRLSKISQSTRATHSKPSKAVKVAVIDATPRDLRFQDRSLHGFGVSRVIGSVLCSNVDSDDCINRVRPYLALPMTSAREVDIEKGGFFGTYFHIYDAIDRALADWQPRTENLVMNIGIGWDPVKVDADDPRVLRVRRLLERASCRGALIVVGAGNNTGSDGPIGPAGLEQYAAPDPARCRELGETHWRMVGMQNGREVVRSGTASHAVYEPLVFAVAAVDSHDQRLADGRRWGHPRLAAYGMNVMVPGPQGIAYTQPMTGTSAAAAIVSGIAGALWELHSDLNAARVMELVYRGGVELDGGPKSQGARTEFCLGEPFGPCTGPNRKVRRTFLCGALAQAAEELRPGARFKCAPSASQDSSEWPEVARSGPAPRPCRIPDCGLPRGPSSRQLIGGLTPYGGFANCPACRFRITNMFGVLEGIPGRHPTTQVNEFVNVFLDAYRLFDRYPVSISTPTFDVPMNLPAIEMPFVPAMATLTWTYYNGVFVETDEPNYLETP